MYIEQKQFNIVVLGGGLAGLAAGYRAKAPVFEAASHVGGVAASDSHGGFTFDRGIHVLQTKNRKILDLFEELGIELAERVRNAHIYSHGCYTAYPFQVNTAGLPISTRARCVWDFFTRSADGEPENYEQWMHQNLGRGFADTFLTPYSEKFWTVHPKELTHDWTGGRVPTPSPAQVLRGALWNRQTQIGSNATFRYPTAGGGYGTVANALATRVDNIFLSHEATEIDPVQRVITFGNGLKVGYRTLVSTIPLPDLVSMVANAPSFAHAAAAKLRTNSIFVVNIGIGRPRITDRHWVHFPEKDVSFFRISYPHNFDESVTPAGMSSISAEVAYSDTAPIDRDSLVDRVVADLIRVGAMRADDPIVMKSTHDIPRAYCIYDHQRKEAVRELAEWLNRDDIITSGRYGLWSYFWSDESMNSGMNAAAKALKRVGDDATASVQVE